jgi:hypothetical protein
MNTTCRVSITYCVGSHSLWTLSSLVVSDIFFTNKVFRIVDPLFLPALLPEILELEARVKYWSLKSEWLPKEKYIY